MKITNSLVSGTSLTKDAGTTTHKTADSIKSDTSISQLQTDPESPWYKVAAKYDVRSITVEEKAALSQELYDSGEISLFDHAILSFDPSRIPQGSGFLTPADSAGRRDMIAEFEAQIELNKKMGDTQSLANNERVLEYLKRLESAKAGPLRIIA